VLRNRGKTRAPLGKGGGGGCRVRVGACAAVGRVNGARTACALGARGRERARIDYSARVDVGSAAGAGVGSLGPAAAFLAFRG